MPLDSIDNAKKKLSVSSDVNINADGSSWKIVELQYRGSLRESTKDFRGGLEVLILVACREIIDFKTGKIDMPLGIVNTGFLSESNFHICFYVPKLMS
jgi:hypothetical protein